MGERRWSLARCLEWRRAARPAEPRADRADPAADEADTGGAELARGLAAWALGKAGYGEAAGKLRALRSDDRPMAIYDRGELRQTTVAELAREALAALEALEGPSGQANWPFSGGPETE